MQRLTSRCAKRAARPTSSQGFALLEALVALLVVALGLLGILGLQMRTLADTQNGVRQAQAIRDAERDHLRTVHARLEAYATTAPAPAQAVFGACTGRRAPLLCLGRPLQAVCPAIVRNGTT